MNFCLTSSSVTWGVEHLFSPLYFSLQRQILCGILYWSPRLWNHSNHRIHRNKLCWKWLWQALGLRASFCVQSQSEPHRTHQINSLGVTVLYIILRDFALIVLFFLLRKSTVKLFCRERRPCTFIGQGDSTVATCHFFLPPGEGIPMSARYLAMDEGVFLDEQPVNHSYDFSFFQQS